jgi:hypothetical protein
LLSGVRSSLMLADALFPDCARREGELSLASGHGAIPDRIRAMP